MDKGRSEAKGAAGVLGRVTAKLQELRRFFVEVKAELKKVTWPGREEVRSTTVVVVATTFFFGFYLWGLDQGFAFILQQVLR
jgi:preprotein translocase subunit SecE